MEASIKQVHILTEISSGSNFFLHFLRFPRLLLKRHFQELLDGNLSPGRCLGLYFPRYSTIGENKGKKKKTFKQDGYFLNKISVSVNNLQIICDQSIRVLPKETFFSKSCLLPFLQTQLMVISPSCFISRTELSEALFPGADSFTREQSASHV